MNAYDDGRRARPRRRALRPAALHEPGGGARSRAGATRTSPACTAGRIDLRGGGVELDAARRSRRRVPARRRAPGRPQAPLRLHGGRRAPRATRPASRSGPPSRSTTSSAAAARRVAFGAGNGVGEPLFVPRIAGADEDDGYVLVARVRPGAERERRSSSSTRATSPGEPLARIRIPHRVPVRLPRQLGRRPPPETETTNAPRSERRLLRLADGASTWRSCKEADRLGFHSVWTAEAYGSDAVTPLAWIAAQTERIHVGTAHHADAGAHAGDDRDDGDDARPALGRPLPPRPRRLRAAGRRGLARRAVRQAARPHARVRRRSCARSGRASSRSSTRASTTRSPTAARARPGSASRSRASSTAGRSRSTSPPSARRASSRRPRSPTAGCRSSTRPYRTHVYRDALEAGFARAGGGKSLATFDVAPAGHRHPGRRRPGVPRLREAAARALHRRHGRARQELLQRPRLPLRLRGGREEDPGPLPRREEGRGRRPRSRTSSPTRSSLVGPPERIRDRLAAWRESGVTTMICGLRQLEVLRTLTEAGD